MVKRFFGEIRGIPVGKVFADQDFGNVILYTGHGGQDPISRKHDPPKQSLEYFGVGEASPNT